jgi:hypothetical protein
MPPYNPVSYFDFAVLTSIINTMSQFRTPTLFKFEDRYMVIVSIPRFSYFDIAVLTSIINTMSQFRTPTLFKFEDRYMVIVSIPRFAMR